MPQCNVGHFLLLCKVWPRKVLFNQKYQTKEKHKVVRKLWIFVFTQPSFSTKGNEFLAHALSRSSVKHEYTVTRYNISRKENGLSQFIWRVDRVNRACSLQRRLILRPSHGIVECLVWNSIPNATFLYPRRIQCYNSNPWMRNTLYDVSTCYSYSSPSNILLTQYWRWSTSAFPSPISPFRWNILLSSKSAGIQSFLVLSAVKKTITSLFRRSLFSVNSFWKSLPSKVSKPSSISERLLWIRDDASRDPINTTQSLRGSSSLSTCSSAKTSTIFLQSATRRRLPCSWSFSCSAFVLSLLVWRNRTYFISEITNRCLPEDRAR